MRTKAFLLTGLVSLALTGCNPAYENALQSRGRSWINVRNQNCSNPPVLKLKCHNLPVSLWVEISERCGVLDGLVRDHAPGKAASQVIPISGLVQTPDGFAGQDFMLTLEETRSELVTEIAGARISESMQCEKF